MSNPMHKHSDTLELHTFEVLYDAFVAKRRAQFTRFHNSG